MTTTQRDVRGGHARDAGADRLRAELDATQELVRLIAADADLQTVLEAVTVLTGRLIGTGRASVSLLDGDRGDRLAYKAGIPFIGGRLWLQSAAGGILRRRPLDPAPGEDWVLVPDAQQVPSFRAMMRGIPLDPGSVPARAVLERRTVAVADLFGPEGDAFPTTREVVASFKQVSAGFSSVVSTPLVRGERALGALTAMSTDPHHFTPDEVALLETFAAQVAVAIENARLLADLQGRLEEQTATAEVLRVISESPTDMPRVLDAICAAAARLCGTDDAGILRLEGDLLRRVAWWGTLPMPEAGGAFPVSAGSLNGQAVLERRTVHVPDVLLLPDDGYAVTKSFYRELGNRAALVAPLLRRGEPVGTLMVRRMEPGPFGERQIALLESFAAQAVIAIENARLFQELNESNAQLSVALEQQTVTAEVLKVISTAPTDLDAVLTEIAAGAGRLCGATRVLLRLLDGGELVLRGDWTGAESGWVVRGGARARIERSDSEPIWLAVSRRQTVHLHDLPADYPDAPAARAGTRTVLYTPLLRQGEAVGVLHIALREVRPFTDTQIKLVETFADQAVIAVENSRLFDELRERDERRRQELERAAAIQQRLLPERVEGWPGVLEVAVRFRPAVETSGDFYDVLRLTAPVEGQLPPLQVAVGDVAGKGMSAALVTALARSALHASASVPPGMATPAATLRVAGQRLHRDVGGGHFVACSLAVVEPPGLHNAGPFLRLANAAQVPVLLVRDGQARELEPAGYRLPLGAQPDGRYEDAVAELRPGDALVFSSDGLVEAPSLPTAAVLPHLPPPAKPADLFGFARLAESAAHWAARAPTAEEVAAGMWADLTAWCGDESHHDDMTLLVLRVPEVHQ